MAASASMAKNKGDLMVEHGPEKGGLIADAISYQNTYNL